MKFVLNTSFDPHFCALFSKNDQLVAHSHWMIPREDGQHIWDFLQTHLKPDDTLRFIGGVSGPGSFSSLRTASAILNTLSFKFQTPVHQARADLVIKDYLIHLGQKTPFLLNSFGQRIFTVEGDQLRPQDLSKNEIEKDAPAIITWLPAAKAAHFTNSVHVDALGPLTTILDTLKKQSSRPAFMPEYEYPAVQT